MQTLRDSSEVIEHHREVHTNYGNSVAHLWNVVDVDGEERVNSLTLVQRYSFEVHDAAVSMHGQGYRQITADYLLMSVAQGLPGHKVVAPIEEEDL